jgi:O-antigen/teichoic acid export membrane protein/O-antigen ligase
MAASTAGLRQTVRNLRSSPVRRATLGSLAAALTGQAVLVVSGVIVARMLGPENRGYLALLVLVPVVLSQLGGLGVPLAITYHIARDRSAAPGIWAALRPLLALQCGLLAGVHCVVLWLLLRDEPQYVVDASLITILLVPAALAQAYGLAFLQGTGRFFAFNVLRTLPAAVYAAGVTLLLITGTDALWVVAVVWTLATVALGLLAFALGLRGLGRPGDAPIPMVRSMVSFGSRGLLGANSPIEYYRLDQAMVGLFLTPVSLGIYTAALAFTNLPRFISTSVGMVAYPHVAEQTDHAVARRKLWQFFVATVAACVVVVISLEALAGWMVPFFFGEEFRDSIPLVRILLVGTFFVASRRILADGARGLGFPGLGTAAEVSSLVVLAPVMVVFLPMWGAEGVAGALVVAGVASFVVMALGLVRAERGRAVEAGAERVRAPAVPRLARMSRAPGESTGRVAGMAAATALFLAADAAAVAAVLWSALVGLALIGLLAAGLVAMALRNRIGPVGGRTPVPEGDPPEDEPDDGLGPARLAYYLGLFLVGFIVLRPGAGITGSDLLFLGALGLAALTLIYRRLPAPVYSGAVMVLGVAIFAGGGLVSSFGAPSPLESVTVVIRVVYLTVIWFWLGALLLRTRRHLRVAIACWVASAAFGGLGAIAQTLFGDVIPGAEVHFGRVSGFTYNVNDLGGLCAVAAVPAALLVSRARTAAGRLASVTAMLLVVAGLLLSGSVSGVLAATVAGIAWMAVTSRRARVVVPLLAAVLVLSVFAAGENRYYQSPLERLSISSQRSGTADSTLYLRIDAYKAAWEEIQSSPIVGVGLARKAPNTKTGLGVHNMFLATWFQAGLFGLLGMVIVVGFALAMGWQAVVNARGPEDRATSRALFAAMLAFLFFGQAQEVLFQRYGWVSIALMAALRGRQLREEATQRAPVRVGRAEPFPAITAT